MLQSHKITKSKSLVKWARRGTKSALLPIFRAIDDNEKTNDVSLSHPEKNDLPVGEWVRRIFQGWHIACTLIKYNPKVKKKRSSKFYAQKSHFFNVNAQGQNRIHQYASVDFILGYVSTYSRSKITGHQYADFLMTFSAYFSLCRNN